MQIFNSKSDKNPKDFMTLFFDMNSFFASVEQQVRPELRGQPIGVSPYIGPTGCIIAASYEAKANGVKICRNDEAKKMCPKIKIVEARPALYMIYHKEIKKVIESVTPYFIPLSIDEFAINLTGRDQNLESALAMAQKLKEKIRSEVGDYLRCSVGISASKFLAKMAAESKKPDGLTILELNGLEQFYKKLKLTDLTGINWRMELQLKRLGINTPLELYRKPLPHLIHSLGHMGRMWYLRLRGYEVDEFIVRSKTIGHSHVLAPEFRNRQGALAVLRRLVFKAGQRLRAEGYFAGGISVSISFLDHSNFHQSQKFSQFCDDQTAWTNVNSIIKNWQFRHQPIHLAVSFFNLTSSKSHQISIFADIEKSGQISKALDEINDEYGADTIYQASMHDSRFSAPDRIPFGRPRYEIRR